MTFHYCGPIRPSPHQTPGDRKDTTSDSRVRHRTIDFHCHLLTLAVEPLVADRPQKRNEPANLLKAMGEQSVAHNNAVMLPQAFPKLTRLEERLADMNAMGVEIQVISPSPTQYYYWADRGLAIQLVRIQNEHVAGICAQHPERFVGLGTLALQYPELAAEQLEYAMRQLGLKGVEISTSINTEELDAECLLPFWKKAEDLGVLVMLHPNGFTDAKRLERFYFNNIIGNPFETTLALHYLIFDGVLERHPKLKILAVHGGGYLGGYPGRIDHAWGARSDSHGALPQPPTTYLKRVYVDTVVFTPYQLAELVRVFGADHVVMGTDYPYDMAEFDPIGHIAGVEGFDASTIAALAGGNAKRLLGI